MGIYLDEDSKMAEVSDAKVKQSDDIVQQLNETAEQILEKINVHGALSRNLKAVRATKTHKLTKEFVDAVDTVINEGVTLIVEDDGNTNTKVAQVTGTENFGITLRPAEWKTSRIEGMENLIAELAKDVKRWANKQEERLRESWILLVTSTESLTKRLAEADKKLSFLSEETECKEVAVSSYITKSLYVNGKLDLKDLPNLIKREMGKFVMLLKIWQIESTEYKNKIQRYFGNPKKSQSSKSLLNRGKPQLFSINVGKDKEKDYVSVWSLPHSLIGDCTVYFHSVICDPEERPILDMASELSNTGYFLYKNQQGGKDTTMPVLDINQLDTLRSYIADIITVINSLSEKNSSVNFLPPDIKDILNTIKQDGDQDLLKAYSILAGSIENNVELFKSEIAKHLILLTSHLITILFLQMECYDNA